jgi:hypothetical protein
MGSESGSAPLEAGNRVFHDAYGTARDGVRHQVPVLVVLPNELALHHQGRRTLVAYSCPSFAAAKSAAHIAVALFALTCEESDAEHRRAGVARLLAAIVAALDNQPGSDSKPVDVEIAALLEICLRFAAAAREQAPTEGLRAEFASHVGPRILQITELATCEQIDGLH